ncbi:MAG: asparagine synthase (glutamine-hydrolyzing) [Betaproteobacteria bacterium]|nr:asparagine synthase (glutamine-hydrolyzing) [Betaproteobacteria bacterium]
MGNIEESRLDRALNSMSHRGPDGSGVFTATYNDHRVVLFHRRLAILDLDKRSSQPFKLGGHVLSYNGEIYNYIEIRKELESLGHSFLTTSDTEVLAAALFQWGEGALDRLEGMWAFAWYDKSTGRLLLSRDRFGEKPLYLFEHRGEVYFASEIKGLEALTGDRFQVNQNQLLRYMVNGYKSLNKTAETFYLGVRELPSGTNLWFSPSEPKQEKRYWRYRLAVDERLSFQDAVEAVREALIRAVTIRLRSDVSLAFCQSGGIDSNSLISIAAKQLNQDVRSYTIVNTDERYEESEMVEAMKKHLPIRNTSVHLSKNNFLENLKAMVKQHDSPVCTVSYYVHMQLMRAMSDDGCKVTISGTGADELFTGYYDHHNFYLYDVSSNDKLFNKSIGAWRQHLSSIVRNPFLKDPELYLKNPDFRKHLYLNNEIYSSWLKVNWTEEFTELNYGVPMLRNRMLNELFEETVPPILLEDDMNAMSTSMENRSPFLDRNLFETAFSIPSRHLIQDGKSKAVLREAMRGIVPDVVLDNRRKVGFNAPMNDVLDTSQDRVVGELLSDSPIYDLVNREKIEELLKKERLENSESKFLFNFVNSKFFMESANE